MREPIDIERLAELMADEPRPRRQWRPIWCWLLTRHRIETTDVRMTGALSLVFTGSCRCGREQESVSSEGVRDFKAQQTSQEGGD